MPLIYSNRFLLIIALAVSPGCGAGIAGIIGGTVESEAPNEAPILQSVGPPSPSLPKYTGDVDIPFRVSDANSDFVAIKVEFNDQVVDGAPVGQWKLARFAGTPASQTQTPEFAISALQATPQGVDSTFVWDSEFDLDGLEVDVVMRFTPRDENLVEGASVQTVGFVADNNAAPESLLNVVNLFENPDERRGIPIEFEVFDQESDTVKVLVQWARSDQEFPAIPSTASELISLMEDSDRRDDRLVSQVCTEIPQVFAGRVGQPVGSLSESEIRLPEMVSSASGLLGYAVESMTLELLRFSQVPEVPSWLTNPLSGPVECIPTEGGTSAFVLDEGGSGWRVREIDLATGEVLRGVASGAGSPKAMTLHKPRIHTAGPESDRHAHFFVASDAEIFRFSYPGAQAEGTVVHSFTNGPHFIAATGADTVLATSSDGLSRFDFATGEQVMLLTGATLQDPQGIVVDPLAPNQIYLAERGADRVVVVDLDRLVPDTVYATVTQADVPSLGPIPFPRPRALALERSGERILVMCEEGAGVASLRGLDLRAGLVSSPSFTGAGGFVFEIADQLDGVSGGLSTGPDGLRISAQPSSGTLAIGGGVAQRRAVMAGSALDVAGQVVTVSEAFEPLPVPGTLWRMQASAAAASNSSPGGSASVFVWDSSDVIGSEFVRLRVVPVDAKVGAPLAGGTLKRIRGNLEVAPLSLSDVTFQSPAAVAVADVNGNGDLDLISANPISNSLAIFFQIGDSLSTSGPSILNHPDVRGPQSIAAGDFDGDGDLDIATANTVSGNLSIFFQSSFGEFFGGTSILSHSSVSSPVSIVTGDLDGDGDLDLASANADSNNIAVYFQIAPGQFTGTPLVLSGIGTSAPTSVAAGDLDGDGDLDLTCAYGGTDNLAIFFQDAPGQFTSSPSILTDPNINNPGSIATADLDGDGDLDVVSSNAFSDNLTVFFQEGPGQFASPPDIVSAPSFRSPGPIKAADFDADGDLDLVAIDLLSGEFSIFLQSTPGEFTSPPTVITDSSIRDPRSVAVGDLDGDGNLDLVSANSGSDDLAVLFQSGPGQFTSAPSFISVPSIITPLDVATGDLDGDGDCDLVAADPQGDTLTILLQTAPGQFASSPIVLSDPGVNGPIAIAIGDLDGDGDLDLASANVQSGSVAIFFQSSPGEFASAPLLLRDPSLARPRSIVVGDLDGDGDLDLASANENTNSLTIFYQGAPGQFASAPTVLDDSDLRRPLSVAAGDCDGDGDMDLVSANSSSNTVTIFFQSAAGQFTSPPATLTSPMMSGPESVVARDLDGDGDLDIAVGNVQSDNVMVFFQDSPGQFNSPPIVLSDVNCEIANTVAVGDLDNDGDLDLVATSDFDDSLVVFLQGAPGRFVRVESALKDSSILDPYAVTVVDIDGDGDLDLFTGGAGSGNLAIVFGGR